MSPKVSVISTVFNESTSITRLLNSLATQTRTPDEVIIVDGGSSDNTLAILRSHSDRGDLPLHVHSRPGANISQGRNAAIRATHGTVIAVVDAGVRLSPDWLEELTRPFDSEPGTHVVSGFFLPDPQTTFEVAMGATVLPAVSDFDPNLPSSRSVAFRKSAWETVDGYPEWLDYCEDLVFDFALGERYAPFAFAPTALVYFRPRPNMRAFYLQYYRYARGDGKADLWRKRHAIRYATYGLAIPALLLLALWSSPWWLLGFLIGGAAYTAKPYRRLWKMMAGLPLGQELYAVALVPCIRVVGDIAKMIGYPVGWAWRLRHQKEIPR